MNTIWKLIFIALIVVIFICMIVFATLYANNSSSVLKSKNIIIPDMRLIIKDNQVDTFYIYKSN